MKWGAVVWLPTLLSFILATYLVGGRVLRLCSLSGPDAGWGVFEAIIVLPIFIAILLGLVACYFARPKGLGRNPRWFATALGVSVASGLAYHWYSTESITIRITDESGQPVGDVRAEFSSSFESWITGTGEARSDADGCITLPSARGWSHNVYLTPMADYSRNPAGKPAGIQLGITRSKEFPKLTELHHSWRSPAPGVISTESYSEFVPHAKNLKLPITLSPNGMLDPPLRQKRIRAAFEFIRAHPEQRVSYESVCRNLGAVDLIPDLIADWRTRKADRMMIAMAMGCIAERLADVDGGCTKVQQAMADRDNFHYRDEAGIRADIARLSTWADLPYDGTTLDRAQIEAVRRNLRAHAQPLLDFAMESLEDEDGTLYVLRQLGRLGRPALPQLIDRLLKQPPQDMRAAVSWSTVFFNLEATRSELKALIESGNPLLEAAARNARPDRRR
jgi:hypothetical protein